MLFARIKQINMKNDSREDEILFPVEIVMNKILLIRGERIIIDSDLAKLYGVPTKRLNE